MKKLYPVIDIPSQGSLRVLAKKRQAMICPVLDIVIVDYNAGQLIQECLESVMAHPPKSAIVDRIVVVDNASLDSTGKYTERLDLPLRLIRNEQNRGFAAACNQGAAGSTADYLLFLNPDTRLTPNSLDVPVIYLEQLEHQEVGIIGIQLLDDAGIVRASCRYFPRVGHYWNKALGLDRLSLSRFPTGEMLNWDHRDTRQVDQVMGSFFFVRRSVFEAIGGFDERFFVYFEEVDFSLRALQGGYRSVFLSAAQAFHAGCVTTDKVKARRLFYSLRSRICYGYKHFGWFSATLLLFTTLFVEPISRVAWAFIKRSWVEITETIHGYAILWSSLPTTLYTVVRSDCHRF